MFEEARLVLLFLFCTDLAATAAGPAAGGKSPAEGRGSAGVARAAKGKGVNGSKGRPQ